MKKKMPKNHSTLVTGYSVPLYRNNQDAYIEYYVVDLNDKSKKSRKRIKLNHIPQDERDRYAADTIKKLLADLRKGWHPDKGFATKNEKNIIFCIDNYFQVKTREFEQGEIREDTIRAITSMTKIFKIWLTDNKYTHYNVENFTSQDAASFMNYVYMERKISNKTFNNYLASLRTIFNYFISQDWVTVSPFAKIKKKVLNNKSQRVPLTHEERTKVKEYLYKTNKPFLLACLLLFHSGIRRTELTKVKISDIAPGNQVIILKKEITKMKRQRVSSMPKEVIDLMLELDLFKQPGRYFLIGANWQPGDVEIKPKKLSDEWAKVRKVLKLHDMAQFYSLRKSGGIQKAEDKLSLQAIKDFFGHVTMDAAAHYYENHRNIGNEELKNNVSDF